MPVKTLVVLLGPTAVGKTELSLNLAEFLHSPILSADSRQLYRALPVATAAPTQEELSRVEHHFVGTLDLQDYYSAAQYESEVLEFLTDYFSHSDTALLSGGSMLYIDAVCNGIDDIPTISEDVRLRLRERYENEGLERLAEELKCLDPEYYAFCDRRNPKRIIHALEVCYMSGRTYSSFRVAEKKQRPFKIVKIGLQRERQELFERINRRVDVMVGQGLIEEARRVYPYRHYNSLNTVGYKELFKYFDGEWTLEEALEKIRRNSRVYAKKQMTWFKKDPAITWFHPSEEESIKQHILESLQ